MGTRPLLLSLVIVLCTLLPLQASSPARRAEKEKERTEKKQAYMEAVKKHNAYMQAMYMKYLKSYKPKCTSGGCPNRR